MQLQISRRRRRRRNGCFQLRNRKGRRRGEGGEWDCSTAFSYSWPKMHFLIREKGEKEAFLNVQNGRRLAFRLTLGRQAIDGHCDDGRHSQQETGLTRPLRPPIPVGPSDLADRQILSAVLDRTLPVYSRAMCADQFVMSPVSLQTGHRILSSTGG